MAQNSTPKDLARLVAKKLKRAKTTYPKPSEALLNDIFDNLFFTSLKTEEGQLIKVTVTLINPEDPDPSPPQRIVAHRWNYIHFTERLPFTVKNLVKLSKAADPWSSSLAIYYDENNELFIWGMVDQAIHYQSFLNYETEAGAEQPGLFQASITDVGSISVMFDYELIANLKQNVLTSNYIDVFRRGPINAILKSNSESYKKPIKAFIDSELDGEGFDEWEEYIDNSISESLSRILIRIQNYHHGGAFLITPNTRTGLNIKHGLSYDRLYKAIVNLTKLTITNYNATNSIINDFLETDEESMPVALYLDEDVSRFERDDTNNELKGAIRFVSSLSCIDGLVVLTPALKVKGFGTVIKTKTLPEHVYISQTAAIDEEKLTPVNPNQFGTRHRSMFSYCWNNSGSLGFVVSQDGDIRAITKVEDRLVMWENIKVLQFIRSDKFTRPRRPQATSTSV